VAFDTLTGSVTAGTFTLSTTSVGAAQPLNLTAHAPAGVTAALSASSIQSGDPVTLTLTWDGSTPVSLSQVVVEAAGTSESGAQVHTAALLLQ
jgi:hypothetical protein